MRLHFVRKICARAFLALLVLATVSHSALATTCTELCGSGGGACTLSGTITVTNGSVIDCSGRDLTLTASADLRVNDGSMTVKSRDLAVLNGGKIRARNVSGGVLSVSIVTERDLSLWGRADAFGSGTGGFITMVVGRNFLIGNYTTTAGVRAYGDGANSDGGGISIDVGGTAAIYGPIIATGAAAGETLGGHVALNSAGALSIGANGRVDVSSNLGEAGDISIVSAAGVDVYGAGLSADGTGGDGDGGDISISAGTTLNIGSPLSVRGGNGQLSSLGAGGTVSLRSGCGGVNVNAAINATSSGRVDIDADGSVLLGSSSRIQTEALNSDGSGGKVTVRNRSVTGAISTAAASSIRAYGNVNGRGGLISFHGCGISVASTTTLDAHGKLGGTVQLAASSRGTAAALQGGNLFVSSGATVNVAGGSGGFPGVAQLVLRSPRSGTCSNIAPPQACVVNSTCVSGGSTGICNGEIPNTDNVISQFSVPPVTINRGTLTECSNVCGGL